MLRSLGLATPTLAAISRFGSAVAHSLMTTWTICARAGSLGDALLATLISSQLGGKMLETRTRL